MFDELPILSVFPFCLIFPSLPLCSYLPQEGTLPDEPGPVHDSSQFSSDLGVRGDNCDCHRHHINSHVALNLKSILLEATESCSTYCCQGATVSLSSSYKWLRDPIVVNAVILGI